MSQIHISPVSPDPSSVAEEVVTTTTTAGATTTAAAFQGRAPFFPEGEVGEKSSSFFSAVGIRTPCACGAPGGRALHGSFRPGRGAAFFQRKFHGRRTETCRPVPR